MMTLSQEQANTAWVQFYTVFERLGLSKHYDIDKLKSELLSSPCAITEDMGTAYKGALLMHINMVMALAQRMAKMISGTFQIDEDSLLKVCCIMHLSKRHMPFLFQSIKIILKMKMSGRLRIEAFFLNLLKIWKVALREAKEVH